MTDFTFSRRDLPYLGVILLAVVAWFYPFFLQGKVLVPPNANSGYPWYNTPFYVEAHPQGSMDAVRENYITWALHDRYIQNGYKPDWNPYILAGNPLLANQFSIPYSPFKLLNYVFSAAVAWSWAIVLKALLAGVFGYLGLRALGRGRAAACIAALAWMLSWALAHQTQTTYSEGVAYLPLLFFLLLRSYQSAGWRGQARYGLLAALVAGFQFLAGNIQMTIYVFLLLLALALYWSVWEVRGWRPLVTLVGVYGLGGLVGAVQLLSSYELFTLSIRGVSQTHQNKGIEPYTEVTFLNPWLYYWRNFEFPALREKYWLNYRWNPYIGLLPLFAFGLALRFVRGRLAVALMGFTLGAWGVLHLLYWRPVFGVVSRLPGYDVLEQARLLFLLPFPMLIIAAYGLDWFFEHGQHEWRRLRPLLGLALGVVVLMALGMVALMLFFEGELAFDSAENAVGTRLLADYYHITNPLFAASFGVAGLGLGLVVGYARGWLARGRAEWLMIGLVAVEMVFFARVNVAVNDPELVYPATPAIAFLQDKLATEQPFRISAASQDLRAAQAYQADHGWFMAMTMPPLMPNTAGLFGLQDLRGYESVYTLRASAYLARADGRETPFSALAQNVQVVANPMLDALNLRYILAVLPLEHPSLELVYDGEILIYENKNALPRVWLSADYAVLEDGAAVLDALAEGGASRQVYFERGDLGGSPGFDLAPEADLAARASVTHYEPSRVVVRVETNAPAFLVLSDQHYPGWVASLDGQPAPLYRANYLMRAVFIPAGGVHQVEFRYQSAVLDWGRRLSVLGVVLVGLGLGLGGMPPLKFGSFVAHRLLT